MCDFLFCFCKITNCTTVFGDVESLNKSIVSTDTLTNFPYSKLCDNPIYKFSVSARKFYLRAKVAPEDLF